MILYIETKIMRISIRVWTCVRLSLDIPVPSLNLRTQWVDLFPTESVTLNCGMVSSSDWTYKWFRDDQEIHQEDRAVSFGTDGATLTISSASALHHGRYSCSGQLKDRSVYSNRTSGLTLDVYGKFFFVPFVLHNSLEDVCHFKGIVWHFRKCNQHTHSTYTTWPVLLDLKRCSLLVSSSYYTSMFCTLNRNTVVAR